MITQGFYKPQPLFQKARFADEIIGGILGVIEAAIIFGAMLVILDSFFQIPGLPDNPNELPFLREIWTAIDPTQTAAIFRDTIIPAFFMLTGFLVPDSLEAGYPSRLSVIDRAVLAAPTLEAARALIGTRLVRDDETGRRVGPDRRGRGLHRA